MKSILRRSFQLSAAIVIIAVMAISSVTVKHAAIAQETKAKQP